ncbi:DUF2339 domain-containing protein [Chryseobacterium populi]|uniref:Putative membrane protein (DUF2339) n=1 Tax=Chryseobacterium populi TaxID=1144316 RepID=J3CJ89_9FLAO|nr:DUF2339 domain-containing protein [Chryseobacterium populi]EJL72709.1 putative membrane protein (DUF2339) [Chryseobacterium populi]
MSPFLLIILFILVIIFYSQLNRKIQKLEDKISELQGNNALQKNNEVQETKEKQASPQPSFSSAELQPERKPISEPTVNIPEEIIPEQKDRMSPVLNFLKQNMLAITGIFTLVLGIGYFVKYAIDKNWIDETARAGIGFAVGAVIMGTGHLLKKNYTAFSSIITGGGIAVLYFTTTIAFREYHLFTQNAAFIITCFITLLSILLSYYYKSEVLIIFSLVGGFTAPLMISTGESNYLFLFTYLSVLNMGMLIIALLKNWKSIGWIAFFSTQIYLFYWTLEKTQIISVYFYIISYLIFYAFALQHYIRKNSLASFDILMLVLINFSSIIGLVYIFNTLNYGPVIIFPVVFAIINTALLFREYSRKNFGIHYSVFAGITISLITVAIALQFKAHLITSVWAVEATLLLFIWKKTKLDIFRICFYILFPLVIIAQMITWTQYYSIKNLKIIFNPIFLTSIITVVTTFANLVLLKNLNNSEKRYAIFENLFTVLSYGVIYMALLLEIIYHISEKPFIMILSIGLLFTIYYAFILLIFRKKLNISLFFETGLVYLFLFLLIINASLAGTGIVNSILLKKTPQNFFGIYLLYILPFVYLFRKVLPGSDFIKIKLSYWAVSITLTVLVSCELYHLYILGNADHIMQANQLEKHFSILYLPIIWAVLASIFIYTGLKKDLPEFSKSGFILIGMMILKLYTYDVWQMDNVSRIIAFIILGIILLLSSFLFQRLKNMIKNMVDKKEENTENQSTES